MSKTIIRPARAEDLDQCLEAFEESLTDMSRRHNLPGPGPVNPYRIAIHQHILATGVFHLAEDGGRVQGFACAIVRERTWFLAGFWVRPAAQKQHIGMRLLRSVWEDGRKAGASTWFVWASSDLPAMSAYMKAGMLPGTQIMAFEGEPRKTAPMPDGYRAEPLVKIEAMKLDAVVRGAPRGQDHQFWARAGWTGKQVRQGRRVVGYYYVHDGSIGPTAWTQPRHARAVLTLACDGQERVALGIPGTNHDAMRFAFDAGLRLTHHAHLLTTGPFGRLERYVPSGAYLF